MWYNFVLLYPLAKVAQAAGPAQTVPQEEKPDQMEADNKTCSPELIE
jgi:hypothetical protein